MSRCSVLCGCDRNEPSQPPCRPPLTTTMTGWSRSLMNQRIQATVDNKPKQATQNWRRRKITEVWVAGKRKFLMLKHTRWMSLSIQGWQRLWLIFQPASLKIMLQNGIHTHCYQYHWLLRLCFFIWICRLQEVFSIPNSLCAAYLSQWGSSCDFAILLQRLLCRLSHVWTMHLLLKRSYLQWWLCMRRGLRFCYEKPGYADLRDAHESKHSPRPVDELDTWVCLSGPFLQCG